MSEYDEFLSDRGFADAFATVYRGGYSPANALWWVDHLDQDAPDGTVSPAADRARLQGLAYSRAGGDSAQQELSRLEDQLVAERALTLAAVAEARDLVRPLARDGEPGVASRDAAPDDMSVDDDARPTPWPRQWIILAAAVAAVLVLAVGVGIGSRMTPAPVAAQPTATPSPTPTTVIAAKYPMFDPFSQPQTPQDIPELTLSGTSVDPTSYRLVGQEVNLGVAGQHAAFIAKDTAGSPCLLVVLGGSHAMGMTCVAVGALTVSGITAYVQDDGYYSTVTWGIDGSSTWSSGDLTATDGDG